MTNGVDRLQAAGLVVRRAHPTDRRGVLVEITEEGRSLALRATDLLNEQVFSDLGLAERRTATLVSVITDLRQSAGDFLPSLIPPRTGDTSSSRAHGNSRG